MNPKRLEGEIRKLRPVDGDTFAAGLIRHCSDGSYKVEFYRYRGAGGLVGRLSVRDMAAIAPDLIQSLKADGEALKSHLMANDMTRPPVIGSSRSVDAIAPNGRGGDVRECNGAERSGISSETAEKWNFSHRRSPSGLAPAAAAVMAAILAVCGEIRPADFATPGGPVGFRRVLFMCSLLGSGGVKTTKNGGMAWRRN